MCGLPLWCTDLRFGLPRASPPPQSPILRYFSPLLDFLLPLLRFKVQSSDISRSFLTSSCLSSASRSNPPLLLALFGLPPASPLPQGPILRYFSLLLDFRASPLHFKVQSATPSRSFWTSSCLSSASRSNPPLFCTSQQKVDTTLYFYTSFNEHNIPYTVLESDNSESMPDVLH